MNFPVDLKALFLRNLRDCETLCYLLFQECVLCEISEELELAYKKWMNLHIFIGNTFNNLKVSFPNKFRKADTARLEKNELSVFDSLIHLHKQTSIRAHYCFEKLIVSKYDLLTGKYKMGTKRDLNGLIITEDLDCESGDDNSLNYSGSSKLEDEIEIPISYSENPVELDKLKSIINRVNPTKISKPEILIDNDVYGTPPKSAPPDLPRFDSLPSRSNTPSPLNESLKDEEPIFTLDPRKLSKQPEAKQPEIKQPETKKPEAQQPKVSILKWSTTTDKVVINRLSIDFNKIIPNFEDMEFLGPPAPPPKNSMVSKSLPATPVESGSAGHSKFVPPTLSKKAAPMTPPLTPVPTPMVAPAGLAPAPPAFLTPVPQASLTPAPLPSPRAQKFPAPPPVAKGDDNMPRFRLKDLSLKKKPPTTDIVTPSYKKQDQTGFESPANKWISGQVIEDLTPPIAREDYNQQEESLLPLPLFYDSPKPSHSTKPLPMTPPAENSDFDDKPLSVQLKLLMDDLQTKYDIRVSLGSSKLFENEVKNFLEREETWTNRLSLFDWSSELDNFSMETIVPRQPADIYAMLPSLPKEANKIKLTAPKVPINQPRSSPIQKKFAKALNLATKEQKIQEMKSTFQVPTQIGIIENKQSPRSNSPGISFFLANPFVNSTFTGIPTPHSPGFSKNGPAKPMPKYEMTKKITMEEKNRANQEEKRNSKKKYVKERIEKVLSKCSTDTDDKICRKLVRSSLLHSVETNWNETVGYVSLKTWLKENIIHKQLNKLPLTAPVLLYGPAGNGKEMITRVTCKEAKCISFTISAKLLSRDVIRNLWFLARNLTPSIICIYNLEELAHESRASFLAELRTNKVVVMATSNRPWVLDQNMRNAFVNKQYVTMPDHNARKAVLKSKGLKDPDYLASMLNGCTYEELNELAKKGNGAINPATVKKSVSFVTLSRLEEWSLKYDI